MLKKYNKHLVTVVLFLYLFITAYYVFVPFFKASPPHIDVKLPRIIFYTIQTNIVVFFWTLYIFIKRFIKRLPAANQVLSLAVTVYISITCIVYWAMLVPMLKAVPMLFQASNIWMHGITLAVTVWLFFAYSKKELIAVSKGLAVLIYPLLYLISSFIVNVVYGKYPYPFLDSRITGSVLLVILACLVVLGIFIGLIFLYMWIFNSNIRRNDPEPMI